MFHVEHHILYLNEFRLKGDVEGLRILSKLSLSIVVFRIVDSTGSTVFALWDWAVTYIMLKGGLFLIKSQTMVLLGTP